MKLDLDTHCLFRKRGKPKAKNNPTLYQKWVFRKPPTTSLVLGGRVVPTTHVETQYGWENRVASGTGQAEACPVSQTQGMAGRGKRNVESDGRNAVCNRTKSIMSLRLESREHHQQETECREQT